MNSFEYRNDTIVKKMFELNIDNFIGKLLHSYENKWDGDKR
jgi:hypothetical protein